MDKGDYFGFLFGLDVEKVVLFDDALPEIEYTLFKYLGNFPVNKGKNPCTDGTKIWLPSYIKYFDDSDEEFLTDNRNVSMYVASTLHELLHIIEGSFTVDFNEYIEKNFKQSEFAFRLLNTIDDSRIEYNFRHSDYADRHDIELLINSNEFLVRQGETPEGRSDRFFDLYLTKVIADYTKGELVPEELAAEREFLSQPVKSEKLKEQGIATLDDLLGTMVEVSHRPRGHTIAECLDALPELYDLFMSEFEKDLPKIKGNFKGGKHGKGKKTKVKVTSGKDVDDKKGDMQEAYTENKEEIDAKRKKDQAAKEENEANCEFEFDYRCGRYTKRSEFEIIHIRDRDPAFVSELYKYQWLIDQIIVELGYLKPNEMQMINRQREPDMLNIEAVVEALADPMNAHDAGIYDTFKINRRDAAVGILVDASGSTGSQVNGHTVLDIEKILAGILCRSFQSIGDLVRLYAYQSSNKTKFYTIEDVGGYGKIRSDEANRDGVAIRLATKDLLSWGKRENILCLVADGKPNDSDYDGKYALEDTARAMLEAQEKGVKVFYFNVDSDAPNYFGDLTRHTDYAQNFTQPNDLIYFANAIANLIVYGW